MFELHTDRYNLATRALLATSLAGLAVGASACSNEAPAAVITCQGSQAPVRAKPGDTFSELVDRHVSTNLSPSQLPELVDGITANYDRIGSDFTIKGTYDVTPKQVEAGTSYQLPETCQE